MIAALPVLCMLFGAWLLIAAAGQRQRSLAERGWPRVLAYVRASEVVSRPDGPGPDPSRYAARVLYDYTVGGHLYHGDCISEGMNFSDRRGYPQSLVLRYATGNVASVHHHPTDPARSVLEIHPRGAGLLNGLAAFALLVGGSAAAFAQIR